MKKLLLVLATFFLLISCRKDEETQPTIVGTWYMYSVTIKGNLTYNGVTAPMNQTQNTDACAQKTTFTFNADGTGSAVAYQTNNGTCEQTANETFKYTYNSSTKVITMTSNGTSGNITLNSLTNTDLSFGETMNNVNMGDYEPTLQGYYFTGTINSNFKKK